MKVGLKKGRLNRSVGGDVFIFSILALGGIFMAWPIVYAVSQSLKPMDELFIFPPRIFVRNPTITNFTDLFALMSNSWVPFSRYIFNTLFITITGTAGHVILASLCAYPMAKHDFPGAKIMFRLVVLSLMFAGPVVTIANYFTMTQIRFIDTHLSLIVPAFAGSIGLFLMKQFMDPFPDSILESGKIDGASEWAIFWKIVMPNLKPAWLTLVIFSFQALWNIGANIYIYKEELKTLPFALSQIMLGGIARAGAAAAVGVFMMIIPVTLFIFTQSKIIETMSTSGLKE